MMRRLTPLSLPLALSLTLALAACQGTDTRTTPLPRAYPRIEMPAAAYETAATDTLPVALSLNAGARAQVAPRQGGWWIDVTYPTFREGRLYLSLLPVADGSLEEMTANRLERVSLNLGGARAERADITSAGGWEGMMIVSREALSTPVQILATGRGYMLTGALHLDLPADTPLDSVSPAIDAIERDMTHLLQELR